MPLWSGPFAPRALPLIIARMGQADSLRSSSTLPWSTFLWSFHSRTGRVSPVPMLSFPTCCHHYPARICPGIGRISWTDVAFATQQEARLPRLSLSRLARCSLPTARRFAPRTKSRFVRGLNISGFLYHVPLSYVSSDCWHDRTFTGWIAPASLGALLSDFKIWPFQREKH